MFGKNVLISLLLCIFLISRIVAWTGQEMGSGNSVEIEPGNFVREGENIEFYDSSDGDTRSLDILSIDRLGNTVTIEGIDSETGDVRTFEMID
ncbi:MAG: DUF5334 family protein [Candidatus Paracaedibacter sp.]